jgi:hypothetical protein
VVEPRRAAADFSTDSNYIIKLRAVQGLRQKRRKNKKTLQSRLPNWRLLRTREARYFLVSIGGELAISPAG